MEGGNKEKKMKGEEGSEVEKNGKNRKKVREGWKKEVKKGERKKENDRIMIEIKG